MSISESTVLTIILSLLAVLAVGVKSSAFLSQAGAYRKFAGWAVWDYLKNVKKGDDDEN